MKVIYLLAVLPFASSVLSRTAQNCPPDQYQTLEDQEFKNLQAELKKNIPSAKNDNTLNNRGDFSAQFYKRKSQAGNQGNLPPRVTLSQPQQAKVIGNRLRPGNPQEERSISERVMRGWCVVFSNCAPLSPLGDWKALYNGVLGGVGLDGSPTPEIKKRHDTVLRVLDSVSTAGAITFSYEGSDNSGMMNHGFGALKPQGAKFSNITINVETKWRGDSLPPGAPRPGNVFATYPYNNNNVGSKKRSQESSREPDQEPGIENSGPHWSIRPSSRRSDTTKGGLVDRDDANDDFCFPKDIKDWHLLSKSLWTNVVHPRMEHGDNSIELDVAHPGIVGKHDIVAGGQVRIRFWISEDPEIDEPKKSALAPASDRTSSEVNATTYIECYDAYIPKGEDPTHSDLSELWQSKFLSACTGPNGFGAYPGKKTMPKYFTYEGVSHAGQGWKGEFFPNISCQAQIACDELAGPVNVAQTSDIGELSAKCANRGPAKLGTFHGGIIYHQVPKRGGKSKEMLRCGYTRITPVSNPGPIPPPPKKYTLFSGDPTTVSVGKSHRARRDAQNKRGLLYDPPKDVSGRVADDFDPDWHGPRDLASNSPRTERDTLKSRRLLLEGLDGNAEWFDPDWHPPRYLSKKSSKARRDMLDSRGPSSPEGISGNAEWFDPDWHPPRDLSVSA